MKRFCGWLKRIAQTPNFVAWLLLAGFLLASLVTVLTQAQRYGITIDEPLQESYGRYVLSWYLTQEKDMRFLTAFPFGAHLPEHGGIFDAMVVLLQHIFRWADPWIVRHTITGLTGWLGVVAMALCGLELGGPWVALVAALGLWLYPRYYGAMYNNPKDIPATVTMLFVLWATLLLLKHWKQRARALGFGALLGLFLGAATAIRVTAIEWSAVLAVLLVGWWLANGKTVWRERGVASALAWQGALAGVIATVWLLATMALWPFIFINPLHNLIDAFQVMSHFPWNGTDLFNGVVYPATQIPASYVPVWLVIGSPPMLLALAVIGLGVAFVETARMRRINPAVGVVILAFAIPLAALLLLHPVLYDTLRQFLFMIPPLILLAAYGLVRSVVALMRQRRVGPRLLAGALLAVTLVSYALVVVDMVALSPYEYIYFSPLVGGPSGAVGKYETDYYGACSAAATQWLDQNYRHYTAAPTPSVDTSNLLRQSIYPYLSRPLYLSAQRPDFFIGFTRFNNNLTYPSYRVIHVIVAEGALLCVVKANPATTFGRG